MSKDCDRGVSANAMVFTVCRNQNILILGARVHNGPVIAM